MTGALHLRYIVSKSFMLMGVIACSAVLMSGQAGNSAITGNANDATGASVPGVEITIFNENTGASVQTRTNEAGMYRVNSLLPGSYRIEAVLTGFDKLTQKGLSLTVGQVLPVDL